MAIENRTAAFQGAENYYTRKGLTPLEEPTITGMKLLGDVSLGSLTLNTRDANGTVWVCTDIENWWTLAEPDFPKVERAFGDGSYDVSGRYQARELRLEGAILVPQPSLVPAARDTLAQALNLVYSGAWLKTVEKQPSKNALITNVALTNNVATITVSGTNPFIVGDSITVTSSNATFNGTFTVTAKTSTTVSYAKTASNVTSAVATGVIESTDGVVKAAFVRLGGQPEIEVVSARGRVRFRADLTAADPIKYEWNTAAVDGYRSATINPKSTTVTGEYTVNNAGNATVGGVVVVGGPVVGPLTIENTTTKQKLTVDTSLVGGSTSLSVIKRSYFDGYATLTTQGPHKLYVGKTVTVAGVSTDFNGTHVITGVPTDDTFSYALQLAKSGSFTSYKLGETTSITNRVVAANTATLTTSVAHNLAAGMEVLLSGFTGTALGLNGHFTVVATPTATTFTVTVPSIATLATGAATASVVAPVVTLYSSAALLFSVGDSITIDNISPAVNVNDGTVLSLGTGNLNLRYYSDRSRAIRFKSYTASNSAADDIVTLTTWTKHGYRVGDVVYVQGCGQPVNTTSSEITVTVTAATDTTFSFAVPTFNVTSSSMSVAKASGKYYRVTVTTAAAHKFATGDTIRLRTPLKSGRAPAGINGSYSITKVNATSYYYDVIPASSTDTGLIEFFGVASGSIPISVAAKSSLATFENLPVNAEGQNSTGGRAISFATIAQTATSGSGNSLIIEETTSTGTVTGGTDELIIDTSKRSVLLSGQAQYARGKLTATTDWLKLAPGSNTIKVIDAGNASSTATVALKYRSGWLA